MTTLGFIGSGNIGSQMARKAIECGYDVVMSNSRGPETLAELVSELGPSARAATAQEAAEAADIAVVTVPFKNYTAVPVDALAGKIVIDTNNYYFERDGHYSALDNGETTVSTLLQQHLPSSRVAKGFNAIQSGQITTDSRPEGDPERRALATASDHADASALVATLYNQFGFDVVDLGPLSESWRVERDQPAYGAVANVAELTRLLSEAQRTPSRNAE